MAKNLDAIINEFVLKLRGTKTLADVRKAVEKDFYKKFGMTKRVEAMAYSVADCVAEKLKVR